MKKATVLKLWFFFCYQFTKILGTKNISLHSKLIFFADLTASQVLFDHCPLPTEHLEIAIFTKT